MNPPIHEDKILRQTGLIAGAMFMLLAAGCAAVMPQAENAETLKNLSQPGSAPTLFAPGMVNTPDHREIEGMFGADMDTIYFIRRPWGVPESNNALMMLQSGDEGWQEYTVKQDVSEPSISPDGQTIYFKNRYIEKSDDGWSDLKSLGAPFDSIDIMRLSASANGTLYFDTFTPELDTPLRYSRVSNGEYEPPRSLGPQFGIGVYNAHPFIAPDESYIIWDSRRDGGYGSSDLYISFKTDDRTWGPAINLGDKINTSADENYPSVSPDGKYLIFDRREDVRSDSERTVNILWVDAQFLQDLRPER